MQKIKTDILDKKKEIERLEEKKSIIIKRRNSVVFLEKFSKPDYLFLCIASTEIFDSLPWEDCKLKFSLRYERGVWKILRKSVKSNFDNLNYPNSIISKKLKKEMIKRSEIISIKEHCIVVLKTEIMCKCSEKF